MNSPDKTFWANHPYLKWFGIGLLPGIIPTGSGLVTILSYFKVEVAVNPISILLFTQVAIVTYLGVVAWTFIKDLKNEIEQLQALLIKNKDDLAVETIKSGFLASLVHPEKKYIFNLVWGIILCTHRNDVEQLETVLKNSWELFNAIGKTT